jgi:hypothetical protein
MDKPLSTAPRLLAYLLANMASDFENILSSTKLTPERKGSSLLSLTLEEIQNTTGAGIFFLLNIGTQWPGLDNWAQIVSFKAVLGALVSNP